MTTKITPKKIKSVFYAVNGLGLGHLSRQWAICHALSKVLARYKVQHEPFFLTTSSAAFILKQFQVPYLQLPSKTQMRDKYDYYGYSRFIDKSVNALLDFVRPDLLCVDTFAIGSSRELLHYLQYSHSKKVFVHRARKPGSYDDEEVQAQNLYNLIVAPHYKNSETIIIPEERVEKKSERKIKKRKPPLYWSGPVFYEQKKYSQKEARRLLNLATEDLVCYISGGGGGDAIAAQKIIQIKKKILQKNIKIVVGYGPLADKKKIIADEIALYDYPASVYFNAFDFAISAAGYNSFHELLYAGVPTIFMPQQRGLDDQEKRVTAALQYNACLLAEDDIDKQLSVILDAATRIKIAHNAKKYVPQNYVQELASEIAAYLL